VQATSMKRVNSRWLRLIATETAGTKPWKFPPV
jgi:hypothetical protein